LHRVLAAAALLSWLGFAAADARAQASAERNPKTALQIQKETGHLWDLNMPSRIDELSPLRSRALRRALEAALAGDRTLPRDLALAWGEFLSGTGKSFLALSMDHAADAALAPGAAVTLFGEVLDRAEKPIVTFEVPAHVQRSGERLVADVALPLPPPGEVRVVVGIAREGKPLWLGDGILQLDAIDARSFGLSRPVLALEVYPMVMAQRPDDPFRFGGLRVVPRGDATFRQSEEPWLFVVLRAPGSTEAGAPKVEAKLAVKRADGTSAGTFPVADPTPAQLRGFADQWGIGIPLPVGSLLPGDYEATLTIATAGGASSAEATAAFHVAR